MDQTTTELLKRIELLEKEKSLRYYRLTYYQGTKSDEYIFPFDGFLRDAINRGRKHCEIMGYRFGNVRPAIVQLEHREKMKLSDPEYSEYKNYETINEDKNVLRNMVK